MSTQEKNDLLARKLADDYRMVNLTASFVGAHDGIVEILEAKRQAEIEWHQEHEKDQEHGTGSRRAA